MSDILDQLITYGEVASWLKHELEQLTDRTDLEFITQSGNKFVTAVKCRGREISVTVNGQSQRIGMVFSDKGVYDGDLFTSTMHVAANATVAYLISRFRVDQMVNEFSAYVPSEFARPHEEGVCAEIDFAWSRIIPAIETANPKLLKLARYLKDTSPYSKMFPTFNLGCIAFSRCTGNPYTCDGPAVHVNKDGQSQIMDTYGRILFNGTVDDVIDNLRRFTPSDWIRAFQGDCDTYLDYVE